MERKAGAAVRELPTAAVPYRKSGGIDFDKLASTCERLAHHTSPNRRSQLPPSIFAASSAP